MRESDWREFDLFAPTPEHALLAETLREFVARAKSSRKRPTTTAVRPSITRCSAPRASLACWV